MIRKTIRKTILVELILGPGEMPGLEIVILFPMADQHEMLSVTVFVIVKGVFQILIRGDAKAQIAVYPIGGDHNTVPFAVGNGLDFAAISTDSFGECF